tara:strand:+ start:1253 stop:1444 length:192 start_codon:yes stop_codon:yes gene_type:complete
VLEAQAQKHTLQIESPRQQLDAECDPATVEPPVKADPTDLPLVLKSERPEDPAPVPAQITSQP